MTDQNQLESDQNSAKSFYNLVVWTSAVVFLLPFAAQILFLSGGISLNSSVALIILLLPFAMLALFLLIYNLLVIPRKLKTVPFTASQRFVLKTIWLLSTIFVLFIVAYPATLLVSNR